MTGAHLGIEELSSKQHEALKIVHSLESDQALLTDFFENGPMCLHWVGPDGTILRANKAELDLLGYSASDYIGHSITEFHVDQSVIQDILNRLTHGETLIDYEARLRCKDGSIKHVLINSSVYRKNGEFIHTRCFTRDNTQQKQTEQALKESEEHFRSLADNIPNLAWMAHPDGAVFWYNKRFCEYTGLTAEQMLGWDWQSVHHPKHLDAVLAAWKESLSQGHPFEMVFPLKGADGVFRPFLTRVEPIYEQGKIVRWLGTNTDITKQYQAEEALRESESRLRMIMEMTPECIKIVDSSGILQYMNSSGLEMVEAGPEIIGQACVFDVIAPEFLEQWKENHQRVCAGESLNWEFDIIGLQETRRQMETHAVPIPGKEGRFSQLAVTRDVSPLKFAQQKLESLVHERTGQLYQSEERFKAMINSIKDYAIFMLNPEGYISTWNPGAERFKGYQADEIIGQHFSKFYPQKAIDEGFPAYELKMAAKQGRFEDEGWRIRKDGSQFWANVIITAMRDPQGELIGFSKITRDLTARKRIEEELLHRTHQLELVNKELEAFSYSVSHDLRAPLRSIDGFSEAILEDYWDRLDEDGKQYLQRIRGGAKHMGRLIDSMLNLSRLTRKELKKESISLTELAQDILKNLQSQELKRDVVIDIEEDLTAQVDPQLVGPLLENLLGNAWKFTSNRPKAHIQFGRVPQQKVPTFFIKDDGAGFDMIHIHKLFGAFQRLHSADEFEGTGIGLATVKRIIHRHEGRIWAEAAMDKGATFYFTLTAE